MTVMGGLARQSLSRLQSSSNPKERRRERAALLPDLPELDASPKVRKAPSPIIILSADDSKEWLDRNGYGIEKVSTLNKHVRTVPKKKRTRKPSHPVTKTFVTPTATPEQVAAYEAGLPHRSKSKKSRSK